MPRYANPDPPPKTKVDVFLDRCQVDFPFFAKHCLKIRDKGGEIVPFVLNEGQKRLWKAVKRKLFRAGRPSGKLAAFIVLKARQMGSSTFWAALLYWLAMVRPNGVRIYTLAHEDDAAKAFSEMVGRFGSFEPFPWHAPTSAAEHKRTWSNGSNWQFGTASTPGGGRGQTPNAIWFSEVAFWLHAKEHTAGSLQGLADKGIIAIYESTARGAYGVFYELWRACVAGEEDMEPIFLPWFIMPEYARPQDADTFIPSEIAPNDWLCSEKDYQERFGLTNAQMAWRRHKIREFNSRGMDGPLEFSMEYPGSPEEAFASSDVNSFVNPRIVDQARMRTPEAGSYRLYGLELGVDPAPPHGGASTAVIRRNGPTAHGLERWKGLEVEEVVHRVIEICMNEAPRRIGVDTTEFEGKHVARMLRQVPGLGHRVVDVNFGGKPDDRFTYMNVRAERWARMAAWLQDPLASIPNEPFTSGQPTIASELLAPDRVLNESKTIQLESKKAMQSRGVASPDGADALACTMHRTELPHDGADAAPASVQATIRTGLERGRMSPPPAQGGSGGVHVVRSAVRFR